MSTVPQTTTLGLPPADDPFFYGYRERYRGGQNGKLRRVVAPMTEWDVLHPLEGDHISQNTPHQTDCLNLKSWFDYQLAGVPNAVALCDCRIDFGLLGVEPLTPDGAVCLDVRTSGPWSTFCVRDEGARVVLVVEITSPSTRRNDLEEKPDYYWRAGVQCYVIVDQLSLEDGVRELRLLAFERGKRWWRQTRLRGGRVWLEAVQMWLGIQNGRIACWDAAGRELLPYAEAQTAAEERIRQLEEEIRGLKGEG